MLANEAGLPYAALALVTDYDSWREDTEAVSFFHYQATHTTTLRASLSGTFLQTLPDLVTTLKGHFLSPCCCPPTRSAPSKRFGYHHCGISLAPKHARKHEMHPPQVEKEFRLNSNDCGFICAGVNFVGGYK